MSLGGVAVVILREGIVLEDMVIVEQCDGIVAVNKMKAFVAVGRHA